MKKIQNYTNMKLLQTIFSIIFLVLSCPQEVGAQHLKFMGIPLNMSIDAFQKRLAANGIRYDRAQSARSPYGVRCFEGRFTGKECNIFVYYGKDRTVYRAKAVYGNENQKWTEQYYDEAKAMLAAKYEYDNQEEGTFEGKPSFTVYVTDATGEKSLGQIDLYQTKFESDEYDFVNYSVHVDYRDFTNGNKHDEENMNDL